MVATGIVNYGSTDGRMLVVVATHPLPSCQMYFLVSPDCKQFLNSLKMMRRLSYFAVVYRDFPGFLNETIPSAVSVIRNNFVGNCRHLTMQTPFGFTRNSESEDVHS